jgi:hypothetical protein
MIQAREEIGDIFRAAPWLEEAWVRNLRLHYDTYNWDYLKRKLRPPLIRIGRSRDRLGEWNGSQRTITISGDHILRHSWESVLDTLRHEMAHQYVEEIFSMPDAAPHGDAFERACRLLRIEAGASPKTDALAGLDASREERDRMLLRIKELLALAGSPNEHEAASAMRMAHKYLLKYNLDLAQVDSARSFESRFLGKCSGRIQEYEYTLAHILQDHFFVLVIWTCSYDALRDKPGRILKICGTRENLQTAEYAYHYVMNLTEPLWRKHQQAFGAPGTARRQYLAGLLSGLKTKLDQAKEQLGDEHGLVWLGDPLLTEHWRWQNPHIGKVSLSGASRGDGFHAGLRDGKDISIRPGLAEGSASRGKLLGGGNEGS